MKASICTALAIAFAAAAPVTLAAAAKAGAAKPTPIVPAGITLVEVVRELSASAAQVLWTRPGDAEGRTLLTRDQDRPGVSTCVDACATEFPPLAVREGTRPVGDWSIVQRPDGGKQWAFRSRPLYTWTKEAEPGEAATNVGLTETANLKLAENPQRPGSLMPPDGWQVARLDPVASIEMPDGIDARLVPSALGVILVDFNGFTLYAFSGDARRDEQTCSEAGCSPTWLPVVAPVLAANVGDFSIVSRSDGSKQWAYRGQPLYRYTGDLMAGDVRGGAVDTRWRVAAIQEDFRPADVSVTRLDGYGDALSVNGRTLYSGSAFQKYWGGRNLRDSFKNSYVKGKKLGPNACVEAECLKEWQPLLAPANAVSTGFWEAIARPDGTRQWAYKGYALYTYAGDQRPGDHFGQATYAFAPLEGSEQDVKRAVMLAAITNAGGGAGIYWNIAKP
jgi:predicted lipoprotein with Yx(FWY)xxD motif